MKISRSILIAATALLVHASTSSSFGATYGIAATVNGKVITTSEVREAVQMQEQLIQMTIKDPRIAAARLGELRESALYALIERQLVLSEFEKLGGSIKAQYVDDDINNIIRESYNGDREKFLHDLAKTGMTIKKFREQREKMMVVSVLRSRQTANLPPPTPSQVQSFYTKNAEKFRDKDYIKFSTITIPKYPVGDASATTESQKKLAQEIRTKISGGADFATMARTYSQDSRQEMGGDWGLQERAGLSKEIADAAFALKTGAISPVTEVGPSYMIIYCEAKQPGNQEPLEKVRPQIEKVISAEMGREAVNRWLSGLASKAIIQPETVRKNFFQWLNKETKAAEQQQP
jgi:parvulin-like peptidyl-prolyl isomerase